MFESYYIYILYSCGSNIYYVGYSTSPVQRLLQHNNSDRETYTAKHRPWVIKAVFFVSNIEAEAMKLEKFIKKQKSRKLIEQLIEIDFIPNGILSQLVRVPDVRD